MRRNGGFSIYKEDINTINSFILDNLLNDVTIKDIAEHMNYSEIWLCHFYLRVTGVAIGETILRQKMKRAAREIYIEKSNILEISLKYGYKLKMDLAERLKNILVLHLENTRD